LVVVLEPPHILGGDGPSDVNDRKARAIACRYFTGVAGAESTAHEQGDGLAQGLMSVPGDRDCLGMKVVWEVDRSTHITIITS
jgi:hypothetical protein